MKKNIEGFLEEITTNFSELFVETFFIRYIAEFDKNSLPENIELAKEKLDSKINKKISEKLENMGYSTKESQ